MVEAGVRRWRDVCECRDVRVGVDGGGGGGDASVGGTGRHEDGYAGESAEKCVEFLAIVVEIVGFAGRRVRVRVRPKMKLIVGLGLRRKVLLLRLEVKRRNLLRMLLQRSESMQREVLVLLQKPELKRRDLLELLLLLQRLLLRLSRIRILVRDSIEAGEMVSGGEVGVVTEQEEWRGVVSGWRVGRVRLSRGGVCDWVMKGWLDAGDELGADERGFCGWGREKKKKRKIEGVGGGWIYSYSPGRQELGLIHE